MTSRTTTIRCEQPIRILMAARDRDTCEQYRRRFGRIRGLELVYATDSEHSACRYLKSCGADIVVLGLELREGDGFCLLSELARMPQKPVIMVVHDYRSNAARCYARDNGAVYVYRSFRLYAMPDPHGGHSPLERQIRRELELMGFRHKTAGFTYLMDAIAMSVPLRETDIRVASGLYPAIAERRNTTAARVERAIRWAIEQVFMHTGIRQLYERYPFDYDAECGRPTNAQFIMNMAARFR